MSNPVVEISDLTKYYGKIRGIENVNLQINRGEIFGFIGPNGAGKSTTIRILLNLIFPTAGNARILGMDVVKQSKEIKKKIGYIPSEANAYSSMDVNEFLQYCANFHGISESRGKITELSEIFDLDTRRKIGDLSAGNKKKVSIIQSLIHHPDILIMDEPTTGLDPLMQSAFFDLLRRENNNGMTVFFSSHILGEVQMFCRRVAIIKDGKIIKVEDIDTLRKKQLKRISIEAEENIYENISEISGLENIMTLTGNKLSFMFSGNINELVAYLSSQKIKDLIIEEPSLEEIFMHYYQV